MGYEGIKVDLTDTRRKVEQLGESRYDIGGIPFDVQAVKARLTELHRLEDLEGDGNDKVKWIVEQRLCKKREEIADHDYQREYELVRSILVDSFEYGLRMMSESRIGGRR